MGEDFFRLIKGGGEFFRLIMGAKLIFQTNYPKTRLKEPVKIHRVPRQGFEEICLKKSIRPLLLVEKRHRPHY